jgi:hypothetical protein
MSHEQKSGLEHSPGDSRSHGVEPYGPYNSVERVRRERGSPEILRRTIGTTNYKVFSRGRTITCGSSCTPSCGRVFSAWKWPRLHLEQSNLGAAQQEYSVTERGLSTIEHFLPRAPEVAEKMDSPLKELRKSLADLASELALVPQR